MNMKTSTEQLAAIKKYLKEMNMFGSATVEQIRQGISEAAANLPTLEHAKVEPVTLGNIHGEWMSAGETPARDNHEQVILYFHGGGFVAGNCLFYRDLVARISESSGVRVLTIEYRLAPEHPYPAANVDCLNAYRFLLANEYKAGNIMLGGDSVGGEPGADDSPIFARCRTGPPRRGVSLITAYGSGSPGWRIVLQPGSIRPYG